KIAKQTVLRNLSTKTIMRNTVCFAIILLKFTTNEHFLKKLFVRRKFKQDDRKTDRVAIILLKFTTNEQFL
ncbi:hypothetical protein PSZ89_22695, partial [Shigella sonnei]|nr:hypothetical protein [Shigella sonnei]